MLKSYSNYDPSYYMGQVAPNYVSNFYWGIYLPNFYYLKLTSYVNSL